MFRGFRYRLAPTPDQERKFREFAGACRFVYNLALEQRERDWTYWRDNGKTLSFFEQCKQLTDLRSEVDWLAATPREALEAALRDLDAAYERFFRRLASYPRPRRKGLDDAFRVKGKSVRVRRLNAKWSAVKFPKIGWIKFRDTRATVGRTVQAIVSNDALGWHLSFTCEAESSTGTNAPQASVGIDRGIANTLALSTGELLSLPDSLAALDRRHRQAQRIVSRRQRGSKRRAIALRRAARVAAKRTRVRRDWLHKATTSIASRFGTVVIEDLRVAKMTAAGSGKRGLNRSILNQAWSSFAAMIDYKLAERGRTLVLVPASYTSQTCSSCGTIDKESRESQAVFHCRHCGFEGHADTNAAINILRASSSWQRAESPDFGLDETRTRSADGAENQALAA